MTTVSPIRPMFFNTIPPASQKPVGFGNATGFQLPGMANALAGKPGKQTLDSKTAEGLKQFIDPPNNRELQKKAEEGVKRFTDPPSNKGPSLPRNPDGSLKIPGYLGADQTPKQPKTPDPSSKITPQTGLDAVRRNVNPPKKEGAYAAEQRKAANAEQVNKQRSDFLKAENPKFKFNALLRDARQVPVGATNRGIVFINVPSRDNPQNKTSRLVVPGVTSKSTQPQILQAVQQLCSKPNLVPYVYNGNNEAQKNSGGAKGGNTSTSDRTKDAAHAGDVAEMRKRYPNADESRIENQAEGYQLAFDKEVPYLETDWQCNFSSNPKVPPKGWMAHDHKLKAGDAEGKLTGPEININTETDRKKIDAVAVPLEALLKKSKNHPKTTLIIEVKDGRTILERARNLPFYPEKRAAAMYTALKTAGKRNDTIISSMEPQVLTEMHRLAEIDNKLIRIRNAGLRKKNVPNSSLTPEVNLKLARIIPLNESLTKSEVDKIVKELPYVQYIGVSTDEVVNPAFLIPNDNLPMLPTPPPLAPISDPDIAKYIREKGRIPMSWNWDLFNTNMDIANERGKKFDINITDKIRDYREPRLVPRSP